MLYRHSLVSSSSSSFSFRIDGFSGLGERKERKRKSVCSLDLESYNILYVPIQGGREGSGAEKSNHGGPSCRTFLVYVVVEQSFFVKYERRFLSIFLLFVVRFVDLSFFSARFVSKESS